MRRRGGALVLRVVRKMLTRVFTFSRRSNFTVRAAAVDDDCDDDMGPLPEDVKEGHFVVQTIYDGELKRFVIELGYLAHPGFLKLLELAEEEFGFEQEGVLAVPCGPSELLRILEIRKEGSSDNR
ncbi:hypothetical protein AAG906_018439 [Vitis piasezkii]